MVFVSNHIHLVDISECLTFQWSVFCSFWQCTVFFHLQIAVCACLVSLFSYLFHLFQPLFANASDSSLMEDFIVRNSIFFFFHAIIVSFWGGNRLNLNQHWVEQSSKERNLKFPTMLFPEQLHPTDKECVPERFAAFLHTLVKNMLILKRM